jgi:predicted permease
MKAFLLGLVSDEQGRSDEMALLAILGVLTFIALQIFAVVVRHQHFEPEAFGVGFGAAIGAAATGMGLKSRLGG